jgi:hypothetical protein
MAVRLRKPANGSPSTELSQDSLTPISIVPLEVSGLLVSKSSLTRTLKSLVPNLLDILVLESGDQFILVVGPSGAADAPPT